MWLRGNSRRIYAIAFVLLLALHIFIFRDVIVAIPDIMRGDASIAREELIPFFDFGTQFWGDKTSSLTSSEEVRVSYSFWTAWVRYDKVLPFALVLLNTLSAFLLFYAFHRLGKYVYKKSLFGILSAFMAALLIHTIMLYSKAAHFYVLVIGFSMFALSLSLLVEQIFFKLRITKRNVLAVSALTLFNPAIHYHVIFYIVALLIIFTHCTFTLIMNRRYFWKYFRRGTFYFALLLLLSLVPYALYIFLTSSSSISNVSTQIPVNYWMIYYASLSLPYIFSLDTAGHLDLIRYGNYLAPIPRFGSMVIMFLIGSLFLFKRWATTHIVIKVFIITMFIVMLFAMWMTIGYSENSPYSFHDALSSVVALLSGFGGVGAIAAGLLGAFINVLRFPHRFQFIYFYAAGILFMISLVWLREVFLQKRHVATASLFVIVIALFPLYANNDYRSALTSGDLATFASAYHIPNDLKEIKTRLAKQNQTKLFILPTLEGGREIASDGKSYSFIDKYLTYYLNQPTYYYGAGANTENKILSYLVYRAIAYGEPWWQDTLADNLGITDILVPVKARQRDKGIAYLPGIEAKIKKSLMSGDRYKKVIGGTDYQLFSLVKPKKSSVTMLADVQWQKMLDYLNKRSMAGYQTYFPLQIESFMKTKGQKRLVTDNLERSFYDIYLFQHRGERILPNPATLPFSSKYVASSNFTNNALSLSTLYAKDDDYNYLHEKLPSLVNLQRPSFVGLTKGKDGLPMTFHVPRDANYRILLHAASKNNSIQTILDGKNITLQKIPGDRDSNVDYIDFTYFYADVALKAGNGVLSITNPNTNAVVIDSASLVPVSDLPQTPTHISTGNLVITPTTIPSVYEIQTEENNAR